MNKNRLLMIAITVLTCACAEDNIEVKTPETRRISVKPLLIEPQSVVGEIKSLGVLESAEAITVNIEFSAPVTEVHVDEGQRVKKGQPLLTFDTTKLNLQLEQTRQNIAQATTQLESETANLQRLKVLAEKQSVSQQQLDNTTFAAQGAQAKVSQLKAQLQLIEKDLTNSQVRSPINAVVSERLVETGVVTSPMQALLKLEADNSMKFVCYMSESVLPYLEVGSRAVVTTVNGEFESSVYSIAAKSDPQTGNFEVKVLLDNSSGVLRPGMTGDIVLTTLPINEQIVIPEQALAAYNGHHVVYRIEEGKAIRQRVDVRLGFDDKLFVSDGVEFNQQIATEHVDLLTDGAEVE